MSVVKENHLLSLPNYIHLNPLDLIAPEWRKQETKNHNEIMRFLENYRWSSFPDYIGKKNFPSVTQRDFLLEIIGTPHEYKKGIREWIKETDLEEIKELLLE